MMVGLLWIVGSYGLCIALLHLIHYLFYRGAEPTAHYVLITGNNQLQIEWYIRSLRFFTWVKGRNVAITIVDEGSTDETLAIVKQFADDGSTQINILQASDDLDQFIAEHESEPLIVVRLSNQQELVKIPLPH